jgi:hypothetical protein
MIKALLDNFEMICYLRAQLVGCGFELCTGPELVCCCCVVLVFSGEIGSLECVACVSLCYIEWLFLLKVEATSKLTPTTPDASTESLH